MNRMIHFFYGRKCCPNCGSPNEAFRRLFSFHNNLSPWHCSECGSLIRFDRVRHLLSSTVLVVPIFIAFLLWAAELRPNLAAILCGVSVLVGPLAFAVFPAVRRADRQHLRDS